MRIEAADFPAEVLAAIADAVADRVIERLAPQATPDEVLDTRQAAAYLNLSKQQLEGWRCRGLGPVFSKLDRRVRYRKSELDSWLDARRRENTSGDAP
jgi:hypothetical protein